MRVLVGEDEEDLGTAVGTLATQRPDAILLDVQRPGMSGLDRLQLRPVCLIARLEADGVGLSFVHPPDDDAGRMRHVVARVRHA